MDAAFAFAEPDQRKQGNLPEAIDLSHHLNLLARSRTANSLKGLYRYAGVPGMVSLAGGLPNPAIFPVSPLIAVRQSALIR
jgi:aromatic amino acid aminotransferase I